MSNLDKIKCKEKFLDDVEMVDFDKVVRSITNNNESLDLYTYFVTLNAFNTQDVNKEDLYDYILKLYSDWYFLAKNDNKNIPLIKLFDNYSLSPLSIDKNECFDLIQKPEYKNIIPISIQYTNKLEEKFYTSIRIDKLYMYEIKNQDMVCRLYINLPSNKILPFVSEFVNRCYSREISANIKFYSADDRCDNVIIYCDYMYAKKILNVIRSIKQDYLTMLDVVGDVNPLLGSIDDYIGFGEQPKKGTYFASRCDCLYCINKMATNEILKKNLVKTEDKNIFRKDGASYTATEYMRFLIERTAKNLIEDKISDVENLVKKTTDDREIKLLYKMRENISKAIDLDFSVKQLKKKITTNGVFKLNIDGVGKSNYDFIKKLYSIFAPLNEKYFKSVVQKNKNRVISKNVFKTTETIEGLDTYKYLYNIFKKELSEAIDIVVVEGLDETKYLRQSSIITNLKVRLFMKLKDIIKAILSDSDDGRDLVDDCIRDYLRILETESLENVQINLFDKKIILNKNISIDIMNDFPNLKKDVEALSRNEDFVNKVFSLYFINKDNLCLSAVTPNRCKKKLEKKINNSRFYYEANNDYM